MATTVNTAVAGTPAQAGTLLTNSGQPIFLLSSGTITATGALSGLTALSYTPVGVTLVYMVLGGLGGITGLYYARFSSTTACQLYTDSAGTVTPSGITAGAYPGTTALQTLVTYSVPANSMGANGSLQCLMDVSYVNNANNKTFYQTFGGNTMSGTATASGVGNRLFGRISNKGTTQQQVTLDNSLSSTAGAGGINIYTLNTEAPVVFNIKAQLAAATDWLCIENYTLQVFPSG